MIKNLNDTEKEREVVLAGISHDLRTPLTRLRLEVEMSFCDDTDCQQEMIDDIEQIEDIIRQFMEFAKTNYIGTSYDDLGILKIKMPSSGSASVSISNIISLDKNKTFIFSYNNV